MKTISKFWAPVAAHPLLARSLQLVFTLALYAVYFLPAVLRSWLQFYWRLRDDVKSLGGHRGKTNKAL